MPSASAVKGAPVVETSHVARRVVANETSRALTSLRWHNTVQKLNGRGLRNAVVQAVELPTLRQRAAPPQSGAIVIRAMAHFQNSTAAIRNPPPPTHKASTTHPQGKNVHEEEVRRLRALRRIRVLGALLRPAYVIWFPSVSLKDFEHAPPWRVMAV